MRRLFLLAFAATYSVATALAQTVPVSPFDHGMFDGGAYPLPASGFIAATDVTAALGAYLPKAGGTTTGPLNGYQYATLIGSSASGASVILTTDGSGKTNPASCFVTPRGAMTEYDINIFGVSSNGADAVMQRFSGAVSVWTGAGSTPNFSTGSASSNYPSFGNPGSWHVYAGVDPNTGCVMLTASAGGSGSWRWKAVLHYESVAP